MIPTQENFNKYYQFLSKLAIFEGVLAKDLTDFFRSIQTKQYHKGEMVTFNKTEHSKLYIVYQGLFKLVKFDENGEEIVLNIIDVGDVVTPMYFSPHYDVCAEFVKNTTVLYFSREIVDNFIAKNHQFSTNINRYLAATVQSLMIKIEVMQLKNAKEKVGWYLVHAKINESFELRYQKTLIAAYLGITPESFSRALSELKKEGVVLENKSIKLKNGDELCKYCDQVTGSTCAFFKTDLCTHG